MTTEKFVPLLVWFLAGVTVSCVYAVVSGPAPAAALPALEPLRQEPVVTVYRDPEHAVTCWIAGPAMACLRDEPGGDWHDDPATWCTR